MKTKKKRGERKKIEKRDIQTGMYTQQTMND